MYCVRKTSACWKRKFASPVLNLLMYTMEQRCEMGPWERQLNDQIAKTQMKVLIMKMHNKCEVVIFYIHPAPWHEKTSLCLSKGEKLCKIQCKTLKFSTSSMSWVIIDIIQTSCTSNAMYICYYYKIFSPTYFGPSVSSSGSIKYNTNEHQAQMFIIISKCSYCKCKT